MEQKKKTQTSGELPDEGKTEVEFLKEMSEQKKITKLKIGVWVRHVNYRQRKHDELRYQSSDEHPSGLRLVGDVARALLIRSKVVLAGTLAMAELLGEKVDWKAYDGLLPNSDEYLEYYENQDRFPFKWRS